MGMLKDFRREIDTARFHIVDEIMGKEDQENKDARKMAEHAQPGTVKKLSSAFVSGFYATRNIQRAQMGMAHQGMPGGGRPGPHHPGDGYEMGM